VPEGPDRVVLVGFMGAGKTSVGRILAPRLGYRFEDLDDRVETRVGRKVASIFREQGEEAFRTLELEEARAVAGFARCVVAAGGGAFVHPETRAVLRHGAVTVWLRCDLEAILGRIRVDGSRPLAGNRVIMQALLAEREPSYRTADVTVDASSGTPREVADRILGLLEERFRGAPRSSR
jgi:shikimate kinase